MSIEHENEAVNAHVQLSSKKLFPVASLLYCNSLELHAATDPINETNSSELIAHKLIILSEALSPSFQLAFIQFIFNHH